MCAARYILAPPFSDIGDRSVYSEAVLDITLDIFDERFYNIAVRTPGVAKLGIALGSGPRDRGFKSRHSDHVGAKSTLLRHLFMLGKKGVICPLPCSSFPTATRSAGLAAGGRPAGGIFHRRKISILTVLCKQ